MATYTLVGAPSIIVSVRGKDSPTTRNKALDKITEMSGAGELPTELPNGLSTEQLILTEAPVEGDKEQEPMEMAVRELQKFLFLKLRTQRLKQVAIQARQSIAAILAEESIEQDLDQLEEMLKGNFKTLKEFVGVLREYRQAKPGAESALSILDEALQVKLSTQATSASANSSTEMDALASDAEAFTDQAETIEISTNEVTIETSTDEITIERAKNGKQRRELPK